MIPPTALLTTTTPAIWFVSEVFTVTFSEPILSFDKAAITVTNAAVDTLAPVPGSDYLRWTFTLLANNNGLVTVSLPAGAVSDASGNPSIASNTLSFTRQNVALNVSIATTTPYFTNAAGLQAFVCTFTAPIPIINASVVTVHTGSVTSFSAVSSTVYAVRIAVATEGLTTLSFGDNVLRDAYGNFLHGNSTTFVYDITPPTCVITTATPAHARSATLQGFTVTFSEPVRSVTLASFAAQLGSVAGLVNVTVAATSPRFNFTFVPSGDGQVNISVPATVLDRAGNANTPCSVAFQYVATPPVVHIQTLTPYYANRTSLQPFVATSTTPYAAFTAANVHSATGSVVMQSLLAPNSAKFMLQGLQQGFQNVEVHAFDLSGNENVPVNLSFVYDSIAPNCSLSTATPHFARAATLQPFHFTCTELLRSPLTSDVLVASQGSAHLQSVQDVSGGNGPATALTFTLAPNTTNASISVTLRPQLLLDYAHNQLDALVDSTGAPVSAPLTIVYDDQPPWAIISNAALAVGGLVYRVPIPAFTIQFDDVVCCLDVSSFNASNGAVTSVVPVDGSNTSFLFTVQSSVVKGAVSVYLLPEVVFDRSGNEGEGSSIPGVPRANGTVAFTFLYDHSPPEVAVVASGAGGSSGMLFVFVIVFRWRRKRAATAKIAEDARRALINVNRMQDVDKDHVTGSRLEKARSADMKRGVSYWSPDSSLKFGPNDSIT